MASSSDALTYLATSAFGESSDFSRLFGQEHDSNGKLGTAPDNPFSLLGSTIELSGPVTSPIREQLLAGGITFSQEYNASDLQDDTNDFQTSLLPNVGFGNFGCFDDLNEFNVDPDQPREYFLRSQANSNTIRSFDRPPPITYNLRGDARDRQNIMSTWFDADDSGDYDPNEDERPRPTISRKKKMLSVSDEGSDGVEPEQPSRKTLATKSSRYYHLDSITKLKIATNDGKEVLKRLQEDDRNNEAPNSNSEEHQSLGRLMRERRKLDEEDCSYFKNHPVARGCKTCHQLGLRCPLMDFGGTYPCEHCREEKGDCEMLVAPERKAHCETCKRRGIACSYLGCGDVDFRQPCLQCQQTRHRCIAGPAYESNRARIDSDGRPHVFPVPIRRSMVCTPCKESGAVCSLKNRHSGSPPCETCLASGRTCVFVPEVLRSKGKPDQPQDEGQRVLVGDRVEPQAAARREQSPLFLTAEECNPTPTNNGEPHVRHPSRLEAPCSQPEGTPVRLQATSTNGHSRPLPQTNQVSRAKLRLDGGKVKYITTRLCHPITFSTAKTNVPPRACDWCRSPFFGMLGYPERRVQVVEWSSKKGCKELSGGHIHEGKQPSKMCRSCTIERAMICSCDTHEMQRIHWPPDTSFDAGECARNLLAAHHIAQHGHGHVERRNMQKEAAARRFCSLCNNLADYSCQTPSAVKRHLARSQNGAAGSDAVLGCGLRLCRACRITLGCKFHGDLPEMAAHFDFKSREFWPSMHRADAWVFARRSYMAMQLLADFEPRRD